MEKSLESLLTNLKNIDFDSQLKNPENEQVLYLAYVGDAIFGLWTRDYLVRKYIDKLKMEEIHNMNSELVCAKSQANIVERLIDDGYLSESETDFYRHARNAHSNSKSKNSSIIEYRKATGFEALLGLLLYKDEKRLIEILDIVAKII